MQTANIILALGGDVKNTIPKYNVTAAEIAVLQAIHGADAVTEIEPLAEEAMDTDHAGNPVKRSNRDELSRLRLTYGRAKDHNNEAIVDNMFPGKAARVFETLDELELAQEQFAAKQRHTAAVEEAPVAPARGLSGRKVSAKKSKEPVAEVTTDEDEAFEAEPESVLA